MSLDVYLYENKSITCDCGKVHTITGENIYWANITHNLGKMAKECGLYEVLWRPEEKWPDETVLAKQLIPYLCEGLEKLENNPAKYKRLNPENGWGSYDSLVNFVRAYKKCLYRKSYSYC